MSVKFVRFSDVNERPVYVNPEHVALVRPRFNNKDESEIYFSTGEEFVYVRCPADLVVDEFVRQTQCCIVAE